MLEDYPKEVTLREGTKVILRPMTRDDEQAVYQFYNSLSEESRRYLRSDVKNRKIIAQWMREMNYDRALPILAEHDGMVVASSTLHRQTFGWGRHVGEVRIVIGDDFRGRGLGSTLLREVYGIAAQSGLRKLVARVVTARAEVIRAFEKSGYGRVAVLKKFVKDIYQNYADIAIMVKEVVPQAEKA
jgi:L-amino acid N-acyltransferase YncA